MEASAEDKCIELITPLMRATASGLVEHVKLILTSGVFVDSKTSTGNTALMFACAGGYTEIVKELLENGANINTYNIDGHTPLMEAANAGHVIVAKILIKHGANVDTFSNEFKKSALTLACYEGHLEMVKVLIEAGAGKNNQTNELFFALIEASEMGHVEIARILLDSGAQVNMKTVSLDTPLSIAAFGGHVDFGLLLIENGANIEEINDEGYTPLMEAVQENHIDMVSTLLIKGANINALNEQTQETPLSLACSFGFLNIVDLLVTNGANLELGAVPPLIEAVRGEHVSIIKYILESGTDVLTQTTAIDSAFDFACENGYITIAELLLHYGANLEHKYENGLTPLMIACRTGNLCSAKFLILKNANVNSVTANHEHTPLSLACNGGHIEIVKLLFEHFANPFYKLKDKSNMIIEAAKGGNIDIMKLILERVTIKRYSNDDSDTILPSKLSIDKCDNEHTHIDTLEMNNSSNELKDNKMPDIMMNKLIPPSNNSNYYLLSNNDEQLSNEIQSMSVAPVILPVTQLNLELSSGNGELLHDSNIDISDSINVNSQLESDHNTALTIACSGNNQELVQLLLFYGANIDHKTKQGFTPLSIATINGNDQIVSVLLNKNVNIEAQFDLTKNTSLSIACHMGYKKICKLLIKKGANIEHRNANDNTPLDIAAAYGFTDVIYLLIKNGAKINSQTNSKLGISPLMLAVKNGHRDAVELLLKLGSDVNAQIIFNRNTALTLACIEGRDTIVSLLLDNQANIEHCAKNGLTPLMVAAHNNNIKVGRILIHKGANVNANSTLSSGDTALTIAAAKGFVFFVELLLEKNANVELKNKKGNSPLWLAAKGGHLDVIELLYDFKADINSQDNKNISCIMTAFRNGHVDVVKWMVKYVSQFPSNHEMIQYFITLDDIEMTNKCFDCMIHIWRKKQ